MKAIRIHVHGGPEVLTYEDVPTPEPGNGEVLIRVHAAGINPVDSKIRSGLFGRYRPTSAAILGRDVSGVVEGVGPGVTDWSPGDAVFGMLDYHRGTYAEYAVASSREIAAKPAKVDHIHAAAIPVAALTAWQALFDHGGLSRGKRVLIHGGGGGVGHFAVQFALHSGAEVFTTAHPQDFSLLSQLGVQNLIDYKSERFESVVKDIDVVLDLIGGETRERSWQVLSSGGVLVSTVSASEPPPHSPAAGESLLKWWNQIPARPTAPSHLPAGREVRDVIVEARNDQLAEIARLVDDGKIQVVVSKTFPLIMTHEAHAKFDTEHFPGKVVLTIA